MKTYDKVFCVQCRTLYSEFPAARIFRTGFYKVGIPLAQCQACQRIEISAAEMNADEKAK